MVCVVLKRETRRVPSPRRIWSGIVGIDSSMETVGSEEDVSAVLETAAGVEDEFELLGPGPGVGLPKRCPPPEKG